VERFVEPFILQLLAEGTTCGYDLVREIAEIAPEEKIGSGNLCRLLRSLEEEGLVESEWRDDFAWSNQTDLSAYQVWWGGLGRLECGAGTCVHGNGAFSCAA